MGWLVIVNTPVYILASEEEMNKHWEQGLQVSANKPKLPQHIFSHAAIGLLVNNL